MEQELLKTITADEFAETWKKYDADENGYIEDAELGCFLQELASKAGKTDFDTDTFKTVFMSHYDKNNDGKIDKRELAGYLNEEEKFLCLIRDKSTVSSMVFDKIWKKYDTDSSGFIESDELKHFLRDTYASSENPLTDTKLEQYANTMLNLYDKDRNGKLDRNEMIKMVPSDFNYLSVLKFDTLTPAEFRSIFDYYDKDGSESIEGGELDKLLGDMLKSRDGEEGTHSTIETLREAVMKHCDTDRDNKIQYNELALVLNLK